MKKIIFCFMLILTTITFVQAQFQSEGKLNTWTTEVVQRNYEEYDDYASGICKIRVSQNKNFDRVVFEFDSGKPKYVIQYLPSNTYRDEGGERKITIAGNHFLMLHIYNFAVGDEMPCKIKTYPKKILNFPTLIQFKQEGWFEGIMDYLIGVKDKKPFRVIELRNPTRVVIDFRH